MRLSAKWRDSWTVHSNGIEHGRIETVRIAAEWVDVLRLGRGDPLVIVPGLAGSWKLLLPLARVLAQHFDVIVPGMRGDGFVWGAFEQPASRVGDVSGYADDLASILSQLGLECPALLGVSFGGAIALEYAVQHPRQISALILNGVEARFHRTIGSAIARRALERYPLPVDNPFINQFFHLLYGAKPEPGPLVDFVVDRIWQTDQKVMAERLAWLESFDVSDRLWRIDAPTLVLAGARDVIVPVARQRALADGIVGARFEMISDAGHVGFLTHRAEVVRDIRRHLRGVKTAV
jgi:pimeloyl-ACP methyl ester carboxylesterase